MNRRSWPRREVLRLGLGALAGLPLLSACESEAEAGPDAAPPPPLDRGPPETPDAGPDAEAGPDADAAIPADPAWAQIRGPWTQLGAEGELHLRLEVFAAAPTPTLTVDGEAVALSAETVTLDWTWPPAGAVPDRDLPGDYTLYQATVPAPAPGAELRWRVEGGFGVREGGVRAPRAEGGGRVVWISDTMWPNSERVAARLAEVQPDLVLHGGDLQYRSNPGDTYNGFFRIWQPLLQQAPLNLCVGNHESETESELGLFFRRIFGRQGGPGAGAAAERLACVVAFGGARFVLCDSEEEGFGEGSAQLGWLTDTLAALRADAAVRQVVVCCHRPLWSFSRDGADRGSRARVEPILRAAGVRLVLTGHNHCYERFEIDGLTAVVDGGAGALSYDPDAELELTGSEHPEELPWRQVASRSHGGLVLDLAPDGTLAARRLDRDGGETDRFTVPPWRA